MCDDATAEKLKSLPSVQGDGQQTWKNQMLPDKLELSYIFLGVPFHSLSKMGCSTVKYKDMGIPKVGRLGCAAEETGPDQERSWALCWGARTFSSKNQEYLKDSTWEAYYYSIWTGCPLWKVPWKAEGRPVCGLLWVIMSQETFWSSHCQRKPICWTVYTSAQNSHILRPLQGAKKKIQTWANNPEEASVSQPYSFTKQLPVVSSDKDFHGDLYPLLDREKQTQQDGPGKEAVAACPSLVGLPDLYTDIPSWHTQSSGAKKRSRHRLQYSERQYGTTERQI